MALRSLSLCSGVGMLDVGVGLADPDHRTVCYVEWDHFAASVLVARMQDKTLPEAPVWDDVGTFDGSPWRGVVDLVTAGFPCQPVSLAGKRLGMADERFIWGDIARIVGEVRPHYVFLENVPGIATTDRGAVLGRVIGDLAALGFDAEWDVFSAEETGAPHRRERWFCLADAGHGFVQESGRGPQERNGIGSTREIVDRRSAAGRPSRALLAYADRQQRDRAVTNVDAGRVYGPANGGPYPPDRYDMDAWRSLIDRDSTLKPAIRGTADGVAGRVVESVFAHRRQRLRTVGNGVVPLTAAIAWRELKRRLEDGR